MTVQVEAILDACLARDNRKNREPGSQTHQHGFYGRRSSCSDDGDETKIDTVVLYRQLQAAAPSKASHVPFRDAATISAKGSDASFVR